MDRPPENPEEFAAWLGDTRRPPDRPLPPEARVLLRKLRREQAEQRVS